MMEARRDITWLEHDIQEMRRSLQQFEAAEAQYAAGIRAERNSGKWLSRAEADNAAKSRPEVKTAISDERYYGPRAEMYAAAATAEALAKKLREAAE